MKCPIREDMTGKMPECDPECAWYVRTWDADRDKRAYMCAVTACAWNPERITHGENVREVNE